MFHDKHFLEKTGRKGKMISFVATPIGNLKDISLRALETLKEADVIFCEDTRHTIKLLNAYEIKKPLYACHKFNETQAAEKIMEAAKRGGEIAVLGIFQIFQLRQAFGGLAAQRGFAVQKQVHGRFVHHAGGFKAVFLLERAHGGFGVFAVYNEFSPECVHKS